MCVRFLAKALADRRTAAGQIVRVAVAVSMVVLSVSMPCSAQSAVPGRFSPLSLLGSQSSVTIGNAGNALDIQNCFKINTLLPQITGQDYGLPAFAGAMDLQSPDGKWLTDLPSGEFARSASQNGSFLGQTTMTATETNWQASLTESVASTYPSIWFQYQRQSGSSPISGGLRGYTWVQNLIAPLTWYVGSNGQVQYSRSAGQSLPLPTTTSTGVLYAAYEDNRGITGCLRFNPAPSTLTVDDTGLYWTYPSSVASANVEYLPVAPTLPASNIVWLAGLFPNQPSMLQQSFGADAQGNPQVTFSQNGSALMLPSAFAQSANASISTVEGNLGVATTSSQTITLATPPQIDNLKPPFIPLNSSDQSLVNGWIQTLLTHQLSSGSFDFSSGRGFYDGITCACLAEVYPQLSSSLQQQVQPVLRAGLDNLWNNQVQCTNWPSYKVAPEQSFFVQTGTDYPEIMSFTLQATAMYCANVDPSYLSLRWNQISQQLSQLRDWDDWNGLSYANGGPSFYQIIPEGSIGGYLGWQALYKLAQQEGSLSLAAEAKARAALAYAEFQALYPWQSSFGNAVVNGINQGELEVRNDSNWMYYQYAWFTVLPGFSLPYADTYHVWTMLGNLPWYDYTSTLGSQQRSYDGAAVSALVRGGYESQVAPYQEQILQRTVGWDAFDNTPVMLLPAAYWMQLYSAPSAPTGLAAKVNI